MRQPALRIGEVVTPVLVVVLAGVAGFFDLADAGQFRLEGDPSTTPLQVPFWVIPTAAAVAVTGLTGWRRPLGWRLLLAGIVAVSSVLAWFPTLVTIIAGWAFLQWVGVLPQ